MQEAWASGNDLQGGGRRAERGEQRHRVALGVEDVDRSAAARPMAPCSRGPGLAAPHRCGGDALVVLAVAEEDLADFEQADVA